MSNPSPKGSDAPPPYHGPPSAPPPPRSTSPPASSQPAPQQITYVTNYIYCAPHDATLAADTSDGAVAAQLPHSDIRRWVRGATPPVSVAADAPSSGTHAEGGHPKIDFRPLIELAKNNVEWVPASKTTYRQLQGRALEAWSGHKSLWVIRSHHKNDLIPGKLSLQHKTAYVLYNGKEISVKRFEVLCVPSDRVKWMPSSLGNVPAEAVSGGYTESGEILYIGRVNGKRSLIPGKIQPSQRACYVSYKGKEVTYENYDVLCHLHSNDSKNIQNWINTAFGFDP